MDVNTVMYPVGPAAAKQKVADQQRLLMDPMFSGPGTWYHIVFPDEVKKDGHKVVHYDSLRFIKNRLVIFSNPIFF